MALLAFGAETETDDLVLGFITICSFLFVMLIHESDFCFAAAVTENSVWLAAISAARKVNSELAV